MRSNAHLPVRWHAQSIPDRRTKPRRGRSLDASCLLTNRKCPAQHHCRFRWAFSNHHGWFSAPACAECGESHKEPALRLHGAQRRASLGVDCRPFARGHTPFTIPDLAVGLAVASAAKRIALMGGDGRPLVCFRRVGTDRRAAIRGPRRPSAGRSAPLRARAGVRAGRPRDAARGPGRSARTPAFGGQRGLSRCQPLRIAPRLSAGAGISSGPAKISLDAAAFR